MDVIIALVFISLTLVIGGLVFFFSRLFEGDFEHGERLSLLPLEDDDGMNQLDSSKGDDKLDKICLNQPGIDEDDGEGAVRLMTVHTAKGLEFPVTILTGCEDELMPHVTSTASGRGSDARAWVSCSWLSP